MKDMLAKVYSLCDASTQAAIRQVCRKFRRFKLVVTKHVIGSSEYYTACNVIHNENGPAIITTHEKRWYIGGVLHRTNGPAIETTFGRYEWFLEGQRHREDGPAFHDISSTKYYLFGKLHRIDGPAFIEHSFRYKSVWYLNGKRHREDGPAYLKYNSACDRWFLNGKECDRTKKVLHGEYITEYAKTNKHGGYSTECEKRTYEHGVLRFKNRVDIEDRKKKRYRVDKVVLRDDGIIINKDGEWYRKGCRILPK